MPRSVLRRFIRFILDSSNEIYRLCELRVFYFLELRIDREFSLEISTEPRADLEFILETSADLCADFECSLETAPEIRNDLEFSLEISSETTGDLDQFSREGLDLENILNREFVFRFDLSVLRNV